MKPVNVETLRASIRALQIDPREKEKEDLRQLILSLADELRDARKRGVTWKHLSAYLSGQTGCDITPRFLKDKVRSCVPRSNAEPSLPEDKKTAPEVSDEADSGDETQGSRGNSGHFIVAAITPDGELYQLEHPGKASGRRGGGYSVYKVSADGELRRCYGPGFPPPTSSRQEGIERFRKWGESKGYEILGGS